MSTDTKNATASGEQQENLDQLIGRLEAIVERLEREEMPLEESLELFRNGMDMLKRGNRRLEAVEREVMVLVGDDEEQPLDPHDKADW